MPGSAPEFVQDLNYEEPEEEELEWRPVLLVQFVEVRLKGNPSGMTLKYIPIDAAVSLHTAAKLLSLRGALQIRRDIVLAALHRPPGATFSPALHITLSPR
jgi:hypothetical protein